MDIKKTTKIFATLHYMGVKFVDTYTYKVPNDEAAHKMALKASECYGYELERRECIELEGKIYKGEPETYKKVVFGKVYTLKEMRRMEDADNFILIMEIRKEKMAVQTRCGNWLHWQEDVEYVS